VYDVASLLSGGGGGESELPQATRNSAIQLARGTDLFKNNVEIMVSNYLSVELW
jgi:hypothetical protein